MNWKEAKQAMREGKRVRNEYFTSDEWFEMVGGHIYAEDGCPMAGCEAWQDEGWSTLEV